MYFCCMFPTGTFKERPLHIHSKCRTWEGILKLNPVYNCFYPTVINWTCQKVCSHFKLASRKKLGQYPEVHLPGGISCLFLASLDYMNALITSVDTQTFKSRKQTRHHEAQTFGPDKLHIG